MKISVIIPVYNSEKFLEKLFDSIINQDYSNYEVIFVNDGSTDTSERIINEKTKKDQRFKIINQKNSGPGIARKTGFKNCDGDLIFFLDSDDFLPNNRVFYNIINIFKDYDPDLLVFNRMEIYDKSVAKISYPLMNRKIREGFNYIRDNELLDFFGGLGSKIFKKNILNSKMFIDSNNFEDFYTTYMYLDKCKNYYYLNKNMYNINRMNENSNSLTKNSDFNKYLNSFKIVNQCFSKLENEFTKKSLAAIMAKMLIGFEKKANKFSNDEKSKIIPEIVLLTKNISQYDDVFYSSNFFIVKKIIYKTILKKYKFKKVEK